MPYIFRESSPKKDWLVLDIASQSHKASISIYVVQRPTQMIVIREVEVLSLLS